jgi:MFS family permease
VRDVLRPPNAGRLIGDLLATITAGTILFALLGGRLGDRLKGGHKPVLFLAGGISAAGYLLIMQARTPLSLLLFGGLLGVGLGLFLTANWALANQLAPPQSAWKYLGLTNLATAGAAALARLGGPLIDLGNNLNPGAFWGYTGMFLLGMLAALASVWMLRGVKESSGTIDIIPN